MTWSHARAMAVSALLPPAQTAAPGATATALKYV